MLRQLLTPDAALKNERGIFMKRISAALSIILISLFLIPGLTAEARDDVFKPKLKKIVEGKGWKSDRFMRYLREMIEE
jgi:hypothetical protein